MKGVGTMTRPTVTEFTDTSMGLCTRDSGKTTCNMDKARRAGQMALPILVTTILGRSKASDSTSGTMGRSMAGTGKRIKLME